MPRNIDEKELTAIISAISKHKEISIEQLQTSLPIVLNERTLQRRLAALIKQKKIIVLGDGRNRRYQLIGTLTENPLKEIKISTQSKAILSSIKRPITQRKPVGYQRKFLDAYHPNKNFYLTENIRKHLFRQGKVTNEKKPAGTYAKQIFERLLIDLSWNSSRLEGNTYSLLETKKLLDLGKSAQGKDVQETQMILNHKNAISLLVEEADQIRFNRYTILNLHALLAENLLSNPIDCGRLRTSAVEIGKTTYLPLAVPQLIDECFQQILDTAQAIKNPFEQSFFVMVHLPYLQPFIDINKRVSRLSANISLIKNNLCPLSFVDVPQKLYIDGILGVYELNKIELLRDVYVWAYERSCARYSAMSQSVGEPDLFRLHHRELISNTIKHIVLEKLNQEKALQFIRAQAKKYLTEKQQDQFVETSETELMSLHEGNVVRYKISLAMYREWQKTWA